MIPHSRCGNGSCYILYQIWSTFFGHLHELISALFITFFTINWRFFYQNICIMLFISNYNKISDRYSQWNLNFSAFISHLLECMGISTFTLNIQVEFVLFSLIANIIFSIFFLYGFFFHMYFCFFCFFLLLFCSFRLFSLFLPAWYSSRFFDTMAKGIFPLFIFTFLAICG